MSGIPAPRTGPCAVVTQDSRTFTFVNPVALGGMPGHLLVIPRRHVPTFMELTVEEAEALIRAVHVAAKAIDAALSPDGILPEQRNAGERRSLATAIRASIT
jgi:Diadenosine tetraphosphate (Ap4A) hydrolase and other HIT family hydrolases